MRCAMDGPKVRVEFEYNRCVEEALMLKYVSGILGV